MSNNFNMGMQASQQPPNLSGYQVKNPYNVYENPYPPTTQSYQTQNVRPVQSNPQPTYIPGRMVNSENDIFPNEVPNDGNYATFVQSDMQKIYMKTWGRNGLIQTNVYELVNPDAAVQRDGGPDPIQLIMDRLDNIEKAIKENRPKPQHFKPNNRTNQSKSQGKEGVANE